MNTTLIKPRAKKISGVAAAHHKRGFTPVKITGSGVVSYYVHGPLRKPMATDFTVDNLIKVLEAGLPVTELADLQASLAVSTERLAPMLGISKAMFLRCNDAGNKLNTSASDRVVRFARLLGKAVKVFGDMEDAKQWLNSPQLGLGGAVPLNYAKTEVGAREVENLLGRIEYGVYS
jgi:putative toxin-antitoxin system antitoxin component (TIGR02293 family)